MILHPSHVLFLLWLCCFHLVIWKFEISRYSMQYVRKVLVNKEAVTPRDLSASSLWEAVKSNDLRKAYHLILTSDVNIVNTTYEDMAGCSDKMGSKESFHDPEMEQSDPATCKRIEASGDPGSCLQGCSLLHLACHGRSLVMLELLLQLGADVNKCDFHGRTPLQHCIIKGNNETAKFLLRR